jgi:hypothetical protein
MVVRSGLLALCCAITFSSTAAAQSVSSSIAGVVVDERQQPVAHARVHAFSTRSRDREIVPRSMRSGPSATTDAEGRFQISGLEIGEYLLAAEPVPLVPSDAADQLPLYALTFYPSTIDEHLATVVSVAPHAATAVRIELIPTRGVHVSGSIIRASGRPTRGMNVRLFYQIGGFGAETTVATVDENGRFRTRRLPPGRYRLTIRDNRKTPPEDLATALVEVGDRDITDLVLTLSPGASIHGRVVAEPALNLVSGAGVRVSASETPEQYATQGSASATVAHDWSFQLTGLSGVYTFSAGRDRAPFVKATRIRVDGIERPADSLVELSSGAHDVVLFVGPAESPRSPVDRTMSSSALVDRFRNEKTFWRQFEIAREISERRDASVLPSLVDWLSHED